MDNSNSPAVNHYIKELDNSMVPTQAAPPQAPSAPFFPTQPTHLLGAPAPTVQANDVSSIVPVASQKNEVEILDEIVAEGMRWYGLPAMAMGCVGMFVMRRRHQQMKSTVIENAFLMGIHYFGTISLAGSIGMMMYMPRMEEKIMEKLPHSDAARQLRILKASRGE